MDTNVDDLFRLSQIYKPQSVGVEVSGQQAGFVRWIKREMMTRNQWFNLASENNDKQEGIRPITDKLQRFNIVVPWFKAKKMYFPEELKKSIAIMETIEEVTLVTSEGMKSKFDDTNDCISQLASLKPWRPSAVANTKRNLDTDIWEEEDEIGEGTGYDSYIV